MRKTDPTLLTSLFKKTISNATWLTLGGGAEAVLQFTFIWIASRELGPEVFGFYGYLLSILMFVSVVVHFGLPSVVVREMAKRPEDIPRLFCAMIRTRLVLGVAGFAAAVLIAFLSGMPPVKQATVWLLFAFLLIMPFDLAPLFDAKLQSRWDALGRFLGRTASVGVLILLWQFRETLTVAEVAGCATLNMAVNVAAAWRIAGRLKILPERAAKDLQIGPLMRMATPIMWSTLMTTTFVFTQTIMVKWLSTDLETGYYTLANRLVVLVLTVKGILYRLLLPILSEVGDNRAEFVSRLERLFPAYGLIFMPAMAAAIPLTELMIVPIFSAEYAGSVLPLQILFSQIFITGAGSITASALFALGYQRTYTISLTAGCAASLLFGFLLIPSLGAVGAAWSAWAAEITVFAITLPVFLLTVQPRIWRRLSAVAVSSLAGLAVYFTLTHLTETGGWAALALGLAVILILLGVFREISPARLRTAMTLLKGSSGGE